MAKTLYIHIGTHKTGSTAIQNFFSINRSNLMKIGILYPGKAQNHYPISEEFRTQQKPYLNPKSWTFRIFNEIIDQLENYHSFILSSEGFYESPNVIAPALWETIQYFNIQVEIKIILFCRRQDSWLESAYQQQIKEIKERISIPFNEFIESKLRFNYIDYYKVLNLYGKTFGHNNLIVKPYLAGNSGTDSINSICKIINIPITPEFITPKYSNLNVGLETESVEFLRWLNVFQIENVLFSRIREILSLEENERRGDYNFLTRELAIEILRYFEESNSKMAIEFFKKPDDQLFKADILEKTEKSFDQTNILNRNFKNQIELIDSIKHEILLMILDHIYQYNTSDPLINSMKSHLMTLLQNKITPREFERKKRFDQFQSSVDIERIEKFEELEIELKIDAENFFNETSHFSTDILNSVEVLSGKINITSKGNDPNFEISAVSENNNSVKTIKIKLESPDNTLLMVYFQTRTNPEFNETNSLREKITKGVNCIFIKITDPDFNGILRIDPGLLKGLYIMNEIEIRSNLK
jgi:hypothetical protein